MQQTQITLLYNNNKNKIFDFLKNEYVLVSLEEIAKQNFICHLVNEYGYNLNQIDIKESLEQKGISYLLIWKNEKSKLAKETPIIIARCYINNYIKNYDYLEMENYALLSGVKFFVSYNEFEKKSEIRVFKFSEIKPPLQIQELEFMPKAEILDNDDEIGTLLEKDKKSISKDEFKRLFFSCHDIIRNNDKLSPEMAFDEISKILFIKIKLEKRNGYNFRTEVFEAMGKTYKELFEEIKELHKDDKIFTKDDTLRVRELTFKQILGKLSDYNLSDISEDIKGVAFEEFLGKTFRGDLGQFFTPRTLVEFMVDILDIQEGELVCDPCCGSGGFLIKAFETIKNNIVNQIRNEKNQIRKQLAPDNFEKLPPNKQKEINQQLITIFKELENELDSSKGENDKEESRLYRLSHKCIFGTDAEPRSARTAKMNMIMQGDGHSGVHHNDGLLNVNGIFENRFDVIITNPPFGASVSKDLLVSNDDIYLLGEQQEEYTKKYGNDWLTAYNNKVKEYETLLKKQTTNKKASVNLLSMFELGEKSALTEVLFMERCLNLLRKGGRMGVVLPEGFLNGANLQKIRDFIESKAKIIAIVSVPQEVFMSAGAMVKSSLVFLKKFTQEEENEYKRITQEVTLEIKTKYEKDYHKLEDEIKITKGDEKKELLKKLKEIDTQIQTEIKQEVKNKFSYQFPIIQVASAGINSIGQKSQNDLLEIKEEFKIYQQSQKLWEGKSIRYIYTLDKDKNLVKKSEIINF